VHFPSFGLYVLRLTANNIIETTLYFPKDLFVQLQFNAMPLNSPIYTG